ncbi:hypothetical protein Goari_021363 [Gossypium aridum]|uniref:Uncharacterized protein n=1 Tax=Gossypium aridum TaxID=34290 RepID=A0A7J8YFQ1_GOSAI|nr:hypothetical protein [Gossypium aridum]
MTAERSWSQNRYWRRRLLLYLLQRLVYVLKRDFKSPKRVLVSWG